MRRWGNIGPSHLFCETWRSIFFIVFFETVIGRKHSEEVYKNCLTTFVSEKSPKAHTSQFILY